VRLVLVAFGCLLFAQMASAHDLSTGWNQYLGDAARTSAGTQSGPGAGARVLWNKTFETGVTGDYGSPPALADGTVYYGSSEFFSEGSQGWLHAYEARTGADRWDPVRMGNSIQSTPTVVGGNVIGIGRDRNATLYAVDKQNGHTTWTRALSAGTQNSPAIDGDSLYLAVAGKPGFVAVKTADGAIKWQGDQYVLANRNAVATWDGTVFVGVWAGSRELGAATIGCNKPCSDDYFYALDAATGQIRWRVDPTDATKTEDNFITSATAVGGLVYAATQLVSDPAIPSRLFALDASDGHVVWKQELPSAGWMSIAVVDGLVVAPDSGGYVHVLDAKTGSATCQRCWTKRYDHAITTTLVVGGDTLYFGSVTMTTCALQGKDYPGTKDGFFRAVSLADGAEVWTVPLGPRLPQAAWAVAQGYAAGVAFQLQSMGCFRAPTADLIVVGDDAASHAPNAAPTLSDFVPPSSTNAVAPGSSLQWTGHDADAGDALRYDVYFGPHDPPPLASHLQTSSAYTPTMQTGLTYHWRVVAYDPHGAKVEGPALTLSTAGTSTSSKPVTTPTSESSKASPPGPTKSKGFLDGPELLVVLLVVAWAATRRR